MSHLAPPKSLSCAVVGLPRPASMAASGDVGTWLYWRYWSCYGKVRPKVPSGDAVVPAAGGDCGHWQGPPASGSLMGTSPARRLLLPLLLLGLASSVQYLISSCPHHCSPSSQSQLPSPPPSPPASCNLSHSPPTLSKSHRVALQLDYHTFRFGFWALRQHTTCCRSGALDSARRGQASRGDCLR